MRVALITIDYPPQRTSAAVQMRDLAEEFLRQGHQPTVIVPSADLADPWRIETMNGVEVLRLKAPPTRDIGYIRRTVNESLLGVLMMRGVARSPLADTDWDLVAWYSPTIFFGPLVWRIKRQTNAVAYLILRDIFPEWTVDLGIMRKGIAYWYFRAAAALQYTVADVIGVQTKSNLSYMENWRRDRQRRVEVLNNWQHAAPDVGCSIELQETPLCGRKIFAYIGNMGVAQGMDILINLAEGLRHRDDIGFVFVGRGSELERLKRLVESKGLSNVYFFDEVPSSEIPGLLAQCHVGLLALHPLHKSHNIPGKFLSYMMAGLPVLARVNAGTDLVGIINENEVGRAFEGEALDEMIVFAEHVCDTPDEWETMSRLARALGETMFSPANTVRQIVSATDR